MTTDLVKLNFKKRLWPAEKVFLVRPQVNYGKLHPDMDILVSAR